MSVDQQCIIECMVWRGSSYAGWIAMCLISPYTYIAVHRDVHTAVYSCTAVYDYVIIIKKYWQCKAVRGRLTPYQSEDSSPTLPTYRGKEEKGKVVEDKKERATRPTKRHPTCSWNPPKPHRRILGQPDRSRKILRGEQKSCATSRFCSWEAHKYTDVRSKHCV